MWFSVRYLMPGAIIVSVYLYPHHIIWPLIDSNILMEQMSDVELTSMELADILSWANGVVEAPYFDEFYIKFFRSVNDKSVDVGIRAFSVASIALSALGANFSDMTSDHLVIQAFRAATELMFCEARKMPELKTAALYMRSLACFRYVRYIESSHVKPSSDINTSREIAVLLKNLKSTQHKYFSAMSDETMNPVDDILHLAAEIVPVPDENRPLILRDYEEPLRTLKISAYPMMRRPSGAPAKPASPPPPPPPQPSPPPPPPPAAPAAPPSEVTELLPEPYRRVAAGSLPYGGHPYDVADHLRQKMPWATDLIRTVDAELRMKQFFHLRPTLLVGPPGCGKSAAARLISEAAGVHLETVNVSGTNDNRDFAGTAAGWRGAHAARATDALARARVCNPIILIDEVEKASEGSHYGKIADTLIAMIERETAEKFYDEFLRTKVDLSRVTWVLTANSLKGISQPLLSRLRVIHVDRPGPEHADFVIRMMMSQVAAEMNGHCIDLEPDHWRLLRAAFQGGADLRKIRAAIMRASEIIPQAQALH
jgi:hypothetical protein